MSTPTDPGAPSGPPDAPDAPDPAPTDITEPLPAGANVIGAIQIVDSGGVRLASVKAGSTAAAAVDPSIVVAHSPNSPTPAGANAIGTVSLNAPLPSGSNNIGDVDVATLPDVVLAPDPLAAASPAVAVVGAASAVALAANAARRGLVLCNRSANRISLAFGAAAVLDSGITLVADAVWTMTRDTYSLAAIHAIASAAASDLGIQEFA